MKKIKKNQLDKFIQLRAPEDPRFVKLFAVINYTNSRVHLRWERGKESLALGTISFTEIEDLALKIKSIE
jgi:hypothetical protein